MRQQEIDGIYEIRQIAGESASPRGKIGSGGASR